MKILVLNGSPKGHYSVTLQYAKYLAKTFKDDIFDYEDVAFNVYSYKNPDKLQVVLDKIADSDLLLFAYPVYTFLMPAQLHKFFEILRAKGISLEGKYVTQLTTSKHFYDVTAHNALRDVIFDLGGKFIQGHSADMDDIQKDNLRKEFEDWFKYVKFQAQNGIYERSTFSCSIPTVYYHGADSVDKRGGKRIIVVVDNLENVSLKNMIDDFVSLCPYEIEIIDLKTCGPKSGCRGCLKCAQTGICAIKDGFEDLLNNRINVADAVVMAFEITMHTVSSTFKAFYDRQFVNGHRPVTAGKPTAYLVSGRLSEDSNLQMYLDAKSAVGGNLNCGTVCDENASVEDIRMMTSRLVYALDNGTKQNKNFYEAGGMRIFRDMIWIMRGIMKLDYDYYKKHNMLDFPQKQRGTMIAMKLVGKLMKSKAINKKMPNMLQEGMLMPYKKFTE